MKNSGHLKVKASMPSTCLKGPDTLLDLTLRWPQKYEGGVVWRMAFRAEGTVSPKARGLKFFIHR